MTRNRIRRIFALAFTVLVGGVSYGASESTFSPERLKKLCETLEQRRESNHIPGMAFALVQGDRLVIAKGFGVRDTTKKDPVTENTVFAIGSCTKAFTAAMVAALVDEGKMSWDDPVVKHLPSFRLKDPSVSGKITLRDLLSQQGGLADMGMLYAGSLVSRDEILATVANASPYAERGRRFLYSNMNFLFAGMASEKASKRSWEDLLNERILKPLKMSNSGTTSGASRVEGWANGYLWIDEKKDWEVLPYPRFEVCAPAGAIFSDAMDMSKWIRFLLARGSIDGKPLIRKERFDEMWSPSISVGGGVSYGFGWMIDDWRGKKVVRHGGNLPGFCAVVGLMPEEKIGFVLLANVSASPLQQDALALVWDGLLGEAVEGKSQVGASAPAAPPLADLVAYAGRYDFAGAKTVYTVTADGAGLAVDVPGQRVYRLKFPDERGRWEFELTRDIGMSFTKDAEGKVTAMTMQQFFRSSMAKTKSGDGSASLSEAVLKSLKASGVKPEQFREILGDFQSKEMGKTLAFSLVHDRLQVNIPGDATYAFQWPDAEGSWVLEADPNQSVRFQVSKDGKVSSLLWSTLKSFRMPRIESDLPPPISTKELLSLRWQAEGKFRTETFKSLKIEGEAFFVHQGLRGKVITCEQGAKRALSDEDFGRFGRWKTVVDGSQVWREAKLGDSPFAFFSSKEREEALANRAEELVFAGCGAPESAFREIVVTGREKIDGEDAFVVRAVSMAGVYSTKWVAVKSGLLLREQNGEMMTTYADFRDTNGAKLPYWIEKEILGERPGRVEIKIAKIETDLELPESLFSSHLESAPK